HLHTPPTSPRTLRPDLPPAAEQVVLRVLAKQPTDRYMRALDFASAFRVALTAAGVRLNDTSNALDTPTDDSLFTRRGLFDPMWQKNHAAANNQEMGSLNAGMPMPPAANMAPLTARAGDGGARNDIVAQTSMTLPSFSGILSPMD